MGSGDDKSGALRSSERSLNELARLGHEQVQKGNLKKAMELFESAVAKAIQIGDEKFKISCYLNVGACLVSLGEHRKGLHFLELASDNFDSSADDHEDLDNHSLDINADVCYNAGIASQGLREYEKAVSYFNSAVDLYTRAGSRDHAAETLTTGLAACYREMGQQEKAIEALLRAQQLYSEMENCSSEALVCTELARAYLRTGEAAECKQVLSQAKMLCLRVDDQNIQGKLYTQYGLIYTSVGLFDEAIDSFERALLLVRAGKPENSIQLEASILQNIGAAYNEKGMYTEAVVYHRKAATLHYRTSNFVSEAKCLCNLAYAQTQLKNYRAASETFATALERAKATRNLYLQFQACEGLATINSLTGHHRPALTCFNQALGLLDKIKEDTGIARERIMEKMSEVSEAMRVEKRRLQTSSVEQLNVLTPASASEQILAPPTFDHLLRSHSNGSLERLSRTTATGSFAVAAARKDTGTFLPPSKSPHQPQPLQMMANERRHPSHKHASIPDRRKRQHVSKQLQHQDNQQHHLAQSLISEERSRSGGVSKGTGDSYEEELKQYVDTYQHENNGAGSELSSKASSVNSLTTTSNNEQTDLGTLHQSHTGTIPNPHHHKHPSPTPPPTPAPIPGPTLRRNTPTSMPRATPTSLPRATPTSFPMVVQEGSLAIGPNARHFFTTETKELPSNSNKHKRNKRRKQRTEIVPISPAHAQREQRPPSTSRPGSSSPGPPRPQQHMRSAQTDGSGGASGSTSTSTRTHQQSRACVIL